MNWVRVCVWQEIMMDVLEMNRRMLSWRFQNFIKQISNGDLMVYQNHVIDCKGFNLITLSTFHFETDLKLM